MKQLLLLPFFVCLLSNLRAQEPTTLNYNQGTGQFSLPNLKPPKSTAIGDYKNKPGFWGIYFWDFGDGTYQIFDREKHTDEIPIPAHKYAVSKPYTVTLYLTPFYSFDKSKKLVCLIPVPVKGKPDSEEDMEGKLVNIETSTSNRIIPGHDARVAVHYEAPADGAGTLLLFYGKNTGIKNRVQNPLKIYEEGLHYGELKYNGIVNDFIKNNLRGDAAAAAMQLLTGSERYPQVLAYNIPKMKKGEQRRLFVTMHSNEKLETTRTANINLYITALWVPADAPFKRSAMLREMKFSLPPVHDPNNIIGPRRMYFRKGQPKQMEYEVNFLNIGKGMVRDVTITIPAKGFDPNSLKLIPGLMQPPCKECPAANFRDSVCYQKKVYPDSVVMTLYNIGLHPKKAFSKKYSKGGFSFNVNSDGKFRPRSKTNVKIGFLGGETMITPKAVTQWRHRALYIEPGYAFGLNKQSTPDALDSTGSKALRRLNIAVGFQNAPLGRGWLWGWEAGINRQHFFQDTTLILSGGQLNLNEAPMYQTEVFDIVYLDVKAIGGFQLNPFLRLTGGLGASLPLLARLDATASFNLNPYELLSAQSTLRYGLLQNRDEKVFIFNQPLENRPSPGFSAQ